MQTGYRPRNQKITQKQARELRSKAAAGASAQELAAHYGLCTQSIYDIIRGLKHASRVNVRVTDDVLVKLEAAALVAGTTVEEHAAKILAHATSR